MSNPGLPIGEACQEALRDHADCCNARRAIQAEFATLLKATQDSVIHARLATLSALVDDAIDSWDACARARIAYSRLGDYEEQYLRHAARATGTGGEA